MTDFDKLLKRDLYVLACESDPTEYGRAIVFEQPLDGGAASLTAAVAFRKALGDRFGEIRIAKLQFIDEGDSK